MLGKDLCKIIESNDFLYHKDIKYTIEYLLKKRLINPSTLIDAQVSNLEKEKDRYLCHFIEADTCNYLMMEGNKEHIEWYKNRAKYNGQFNPSISHKYDLSDKEKDERRNFFENVYGFNPEVKL